LDGPLGIRNEAQYTDFGTFTIAAHCSFVEPADTFVEKDRDRRK